MRGGRAGGSHAAVEALTGRGGEANARSDRRDLALAETLELNQTREAQIGRRAYHPEDVGPPGLPRPVVPDAWRHRQAWVEMWRLRGGGY